MITPQQSRMARAALDLGVRDLADLAKVSPNTIARLERGERMHSRTLDYIRGALELAGVTFVASDAVSAAGGIGVRLRDASPETALGRLLDQMASIPSPTKVPEQAFDAVLDAADRYLDLAKEQGRELDAWEKDDLNGMLGALACSWLHLAVTMLWHATTPPDEQSLDYPIPAERVAAVASLDIPHFRHQIAALRYRGYVSHSRSA